MPAIKTAIDGLWRCLCPSIDNLVASGTLRRLRPLRNASVRPQVRTTKTLRSQSRVQHLHTAPRHQKIPIESDHHEAPRIHSRYYDTTIRTTYNDPEPEYERLNRIPLPSLHDDLRQLATEPNKYHKITELVEYLVTFREKPCLLHYDALIRANADPYYGSAEVVGRLLRETKELGVGADSALYHGALQALAIHPDYLLRNQVMQEMKERWFGLSPDGWHNLVAGLLRDKQLESAMNRLEQMETDQIEIQPWLHAIFLYRLCEVGELDEAFRLLKQCWLHAESGVDYTMYYHLLDKFSSAFHYEGTKFIWHHQVRTSYINPSDGMCLAVLNVAARHADPELARSVIRILSSRRSTLASHHYEALLEATIKSQDLKTALRILTIMSKGGIEPDSGITRSLYLYLSQFVHLPYEAWNILKSMREEGHIIPTGAVNVILEASVFQRNIEEAIDLYKQLHTVCASGPNTETFNVLLQGLRRSKSSMKDTAMFLAAEMTALGVKPDRITYDRLILVCLDEGDYEDAFKYLEEMIMVGTSRGETWWMRKGTVSRLIQICTVAGDKRAWELLEEMGKREIRAVDLKQWVRENWKSSRVIEKRSSSHRE